MRDAAPAAGWLWETDARHRLTHVFGRADGGAGAALGLRPWELPGVQPQGMEAIAAEMRARRPFTHAEWLRRDAAGRLHRCRVSGEPVYGPRGGFRGYRGVGLDLTSALATEHALSATESQLAAIIDSAMDAILTVDAGHRVLVCNEAATQLFGLRRADALDLPLAQLLPGGMASILAACGGPGQGWNHLRCGPVEAVRAGGERFPVEISVSRLSVGGNELFTLVLRDLADRVAWERARATLETQLRESQKMEALGTLAGGIAHDFNNIVAAILGNAALAEGRLGRPAAAAVFLQEIVKAGLRARELVERIMAFSRRQPAVYTCQPLQPVIAEGVQLLRATLPSGIGVDYAACDETLHAKVDATQVGQVLMNLGTNAWQALGSQPGRVTVRLAREGNEARLSVADNGCGMDEATRARIFEPFFTTKPKGEGTGLGLPVVHGVVTGHGGRIEVTSRKGEGTRFDIFLPLARVAPGAEPAPAAPLPRPPRRGNGEHLVYLDDYPAMVFMARAALEALGWRVSGFEHVADAMAFMREHADSVDLFITDYNMPGRSGLDVARDVLALKPGLPVVVASGYVTDELREGARQAGVARLFDKPRGIEGLCEMVGALLAGEA